AGYKRQENKTIKQAKKQFSLFSFWFLNRRKNDGIESEQLYHSLFLNTTMPVWITDRKNLKILEVNQAAIQFYGYDRESFLSKTAFDILDRIDVSALGPAHKHTMGNHLVIRAGYKNRDDINVWIDLMINNVVYKEREVYLICHAVNNDN
ncbi:MAG TPA: PAS domain-containing protein, partial [Flavisolibacter sp.]|nr:PAS domain-containing protein [Flavisolibacter sp.]